MPKFILDLRWTSNGLENVPNGAFLGIRKDARDFATSNGLTIIQIIDRLVPPVGPIWIVEGDEQNVATVAARFSGFGNVTATYSRYIADATDDELKANLSALFAKRPR